jgi:hypothetical protein
VVVDTPHHPFSFFHICCCLFLGFYVVPCALLVVVEPLWGVFIISVDTAYVVLLCGEFMGLLGCVVSSTLFYCVANSLPDLGCKRLWYFFHHFFMAVFVIATTVKRWRSCNITHLPASVVCFWPLSFWWLLFLRLCFGNFFFEEGKLAHSNWHQIKSNLRP